MAPPPSARGSLPADLSGVRTRSPERGEPRSSFAEGTLPFVWLRLVLRSFGSTVWLLRSRRKGSASLRVVRRNAPPCLELSSSFLPPPPLHSQLWWWWRGRARGSLIQRPQRKTSCSVSMLQFLLIANSCR